MIIVDTALEAREAEGRPIRVALFGAGFMARGITNQILHSSRGIRLVAIFNRTAQKALECYKYADEGLDPLVVDSQVALDEAIVGGRPVVTEDAMLLCRSPHIDILVDVTGAVEFGAHAVLEAFRHGKHVILMNAELDATLGPILQVYARQHGVILSACDGDQPGVEINLYRFVKGLGLIPRVMGNIKGLQDPYRTPTTQKAFAERWGQKPSMVTSFADGSKVSFEQAVVANATGMTVARRGMLAYEHREHVDTLTNRYDIDVLRELGGIVEYVVGAQPGPGIFCLAEHTDPRQQHYLNLYKLGEGPLYSFYTPYHLCHFEVPNTIARVALFGDATGRAIGGPFVEVCAVAKRDLKAGETLDDYGHYMTYGEAATASEMRAKRYLPEGLVEGCRLTRDLPKDAVITFDDVVLPANRLSDRLYQEQCETFALPAEAGSHNKAGSQAAVVASGSTRKHRTDHALAS
jgi:predicted homoserine dehydrogenase-like protein